MPYKKLAISIALLSMIATAHADTIEDGGIWLSLSAQGAISDTKFNWFFELQPRWREEGSELGAVVIRPAISYQLSSNSSIWLGYAQVVNHPAGKPARDESRLWEQYTYNFDKIGTVAIQSRTRLEQRRLDDASDTEHRLRQMIKVSVPFSFNPSLSAIASDEYFVRLNNTDWSGTSGFDQNRLFLGMGYKFNDHLKLEAGYLNQYVNKPNVDNMNHILSTSVGYSF
ncbi:MAG: DUF2490 domain-containing protein [Methylophilaceae bacterium]